MSDASRRDEIERPADESEGGRHEPPDRTAPGEAPSSGDAVASGGEAAVGGDANVPPGGPDDLRSAAEAAALADLAERETAYGLLQRGLALMKRRHYAQAAVILERAARLEPHKGSIVEPLGRAYYNSGQHELAASAFEELLIVDPSLAYAHFGLGQSLKRLGRTAEARKHLRLAVALAPGSRLYRDALARLG